MQKLDILRCWGKKKKQYPFCSYGLSFHDYEFRFNILSYSNYFFLLPIQLLEPQKQRQVLQLLLLEDCFSPSKHSSIDYCKRFWEKGISAPVTPLFCEKGREGKQQLPSHTEQGMLPGDVPAALGGDSPWLKTLSVLSTSSANSCDTSKCFNPLELNSLLQRIMLINSLPVSGRRDTSRNCSV